MQRLTSQRHCAKYASYHMTAAIYEYTAADARLHRCRWSSNYSMLSTALINYHAVCGAGPGSLCHMNYSELISWRKCNECTAALPYAVSIAAPSIQATSAAAKAGALLVYSLSILQYDAPGGETAV
jgi:hypothetical protein